MGWALNDCTAPAAKDPGQQVLFAGSVPSLHSIPTTASAAAPCGTGVPCGTTCGTEGGHGR
jgi:hypothetical protein